MAAVVATTVPNEADATVSDVADTSLNRAPTGTDKVETEALANVAAAADSEDVKVPEVKLADVAESVPGDATVAAPVTERLFTVIGLVTMPTVSVDDDVLAVTAIWLGVPVGARPEMALAAVA